MQLSKGIEMWLYDSYNEIDLKIHKALIKAKQSIMNSTNLDLKTIMTKNAAGQKSIRADLVSEKIFLETLVREDLSGILYSEESGIKEFGNLGSDNDIMLLLDPLDGSQNYQKGLPFGCISVAYGNNVDNPTIGDLKKASVLNLYADEIYFVTKDHGAYFNNHKLNKQNGSSLENTLDFSSIQISYYSYENKNSEHNRSFTKQYSLRSLGSAAWELAMVSNERNDAYTDIRGVIKAHDFAAGIIILQEVGGYIEFLELNGFSSYNQIPINDFRSGYSLIASKNKKLLNNIMKELR